MKPGGIVLLSTAGLTPAHPLMVTVNDALLKEFKEDEEVEG